MKWFVTALLLLTFHSVVAEEIDSAMVNLDEAEFYLLDIKDNNKVVTTAVDAYVYQGQLYIAFVPVFEGLKINYSFFNGQLNTDFADEKLNFELLTSSSENGRWFSDGAFNFIRVDLLEEILKSSAELNTNTLSLDFSGHTYSFPYELIKSQAKQRRANQFNTEVASNGTNKAKKVITVPDQYQLFTVPNGYLNATYERSNQRENYDVIGQTVSDLLYHSANFTLTTDEEQTTSRLNFTRYPNAGKKYLGIWDQYSFGDVFVRSSTGNNSEKGLGLNFLTRSDQTEFDNLTTSFGKTAPPGWDADVFRNGVFLYSQKVPDDGLLEFNNVELLYGYNEFKIELYGPFGERRTLIENIEVRKNALSQGNVSYGLSLVEEDSSLLDFKLDELEFDVLNANFSVGVTDTWQVGLATTINNLSDSENKTAQYQVSNKLALPGWYIDNALVVSEQQLNQTTSLATSFFSNDSLTLQYNSRWDRGEDDTEFLGGELNLNYHIRNKQFVNQFTLINNDTDNAFRSFSHRFSYFLQGYNLSNTLSYQESNGEEGTWQGAFSAVTRLSNNIRLLASLPYNITDGFEFDKNAANFSVNYYIRKDEGSHNFQLSASSLFDNPTWTTSYRYALNALTHQLTFGASYNSEDRWNLRAGLLVNFGYDYFNNSMIFSNNSIQNSGNIDVHAYLDRRLNGIPDVLDHNLAGVTFVGRADWENLETNENGRVRLYGAGNGTTALQGLWQSGGETIVNDYLIYSHPGSNQRINMPFYLTTELESFLLLQTNDQELPLSGVTVYAKNVNTGDVYDIASDNDGFINLVDLVPGRYSVYPDPDYLAEKRLVAEHKQIDFDSPLKGGYVILPNIVLKPRDEATEGAILELQLDDKTNYIPIALDDDNKLVHLPPKGTFKTPYTSDDFSKLEFKRIKARDIKQQRKALREELALAENRGRLNTYGVQSAVISKSLFTETPVTAEALVQEPVISESENGIALDGVFEIQQEQPEQPESVVTPEINDTQTVDASTEQARTLESLGNGWLVQVASASTFETATSIIANSDFNGRLYVAEKEVNGKTWYCVVSEELATKAEAEALLSQSSITGFVSPARIYKGII